MKPFYTLIVVMLTACICNGQQAVYMSSIPPLPVKVIFSTPTSITITVEQAINIKPKSLGTLSANGNQVMVFVCEISGNRITLVPAAGGPLALAYNQGDTISLKLIEDPGGVMEKQDPCNRSISL